MLRRFPLWCFPVVLTLMGPMACASIAGQPQMAQAAKTEASAEASPTANPTASSTAGSEDTEAEVATKSGLINTLKWRTATEIDNFAFDVYRGDFEEGPFVRLTTSPIPGSGTSDVPTRYEYSDDSIEPNRAYYYYVESISIGGVRERFTPVFRSKPKTPKGTQDGDQDG